MIKSLRVPRALAQQWQRLSRRDRGMLVGLAVFLLAVILFCGLWQPAQHRLEISEGLYRQRLLLATEMQQARPVHQAALGQQASAQPLSTRLSETALAAGLELQQLDQDEQSLRVTILGDAKTLLGWLDQIEQSGEVLQSLSLEAREKKLEARVVWTSS